MFVDVSFTVDAFSRFLRYRIAELYEPVATPFPFPSSSGPLHYLEGLAVQSVDVTTSESSDAFFLNARNPAGSGQNLVQAIPMVASIAAPRLDLYVL